METIQIEKGIPLPAISRKYPTIPLHQMEVGDSILITGGATKNLRVKLTVYQKKHGVRFATRSMKTEGGIRVWRVS